MTDKQLATLLLQIVSNLRNIFWRMNAPLLEQGAKRERVHSRIYDYDRECNGNPLLGRACTVPEHFCDGDTAEAIDVVWEYADELQAQANALCGREDAG